jgi:hypothetical protein
VDSDLRKKIVAIARANPGRGYKTLAAMLRAKGTTVKKAEIAKVLRIQQANPKTKPTKPRTAPGQQTRGAKPKWQGAAAPRPEPSTPLCTSCGMRVSVLGQCRCS